MEWWSENPNYSKSNLEELCNRGIKLYNSGKIRGILFEVFNIQESEYIKYYMNENAQGVKYMIDRLC